MSLSPVLHFHLHLVKKTLEKAQIFSSLCQGVKKKI